jgi:hypothetical protein
MSVEPHHNGRAFGTPVPGSTASARNPTRDQLTSPAGGTGDTAGVPFYAPQPPPLPGSIATTPRHPLATGHNPRFQHEPAGFGPTPAGFPHHPAFGYPGPRTLFGGGRHTFGDAVAQRPNTLAILALVFAFCSPLAGLVLGLIAKKQIAESGERGDGMALAGIIVGALFTVVAAVWMVAGIIAWIQLGQALASQHEAAATAF